MSILISQKILASIREELSQSRESFLLISAYCKLPLVQYFDSCISSEIEKKLVVRFREDDLLSGASDLDIYPYCRDHGWKLYFRLDLHAKTYVFDRLRCIIGSANATSSGLSIGGIGNYEMATVCPLADSDVKILDRLLLGSVEMNDVLYDTMCQIISKAPGNTVSGTGWPAEITKLFSPDYSILFAEDFPPCVHFSNATFEDLLFLGEPVNCAADEIKQAFRYSKCFLWLLSLIETQENKELYFGTITQHLHSVLLNEPQPYRKDVKQLLSNLLTWIEELGMEKLQVDRPHHSQRVRYISHDEV